MKFLVDAQLPPVLARRLVELGHEATHVYETGLIDASDEAIWNHALANQFAIITKDEDFVSKVLLKLPKAPVIWIRVGNCRNTALLTWFGSVLPEILNRLNQGEFFVEVA